MNLNKWMQTNNTATATKEKKIEIYNKKNLYVYVFIPQKLLIIML